ncbi:MAG: tRNA pseudouridine(55) synthase TruB [Bacteroidetes bacterium]|nr:tRNA pseudouridine(55) synthase TruB [Bacteroidota bacterium]
MITKLTSHKIDVDFQKGQSILIDKPFSWTSFKVVHQIRKAVKVKKVGHAGTLDPRATGLLIICTGKMTKSISQFQDLPKTYSGIITLGKKTKSMDLETEPFEEKPVENISEEDILEVRDKFIGEIEQIPPMYSAVKVKGKRLYKYARKGETVEREKRNINIYKFEIEKVELPDIHFKIICSKGTYIRVIANDFGDELGCGGLLSKLRRENIGEHTVDQALTIDEFEKRYSCN